MGRCFGDFAFSSAHGTIKLELYGQMFWRFCLFIRPRHNQASIVWADVLAILKIIRLKPLLLLNIERNSSRNAKAFLEARYIRQM
jgi:hypothetical protein